MRIAGIVVAAALSWVSVRAHADTSKAWAAAKAGLPADAKVVIGIDLAAIQKTQLFATYYPKLLAKSDGGKVIDAMKAACKLDPLTSVQGVVIATTLDQEDGASYIALSGIDKAKLSSCLPLAIQSGDKDAKVAIKHDGNITQITKGTTIAYVGWASKDVLVVPFKTEDKAAVTRWMSGKGALAKAELGKTLGKLNTSAAVWGAGNAGKDGKEIESGITVKLGYGTLVFAKGNLDVDVHAVMGDAKQAATMAAEAKTQIDQARQGGVMPPAISGMLKAVAITTANDEIVVKASVAEKDLASALELALSLAGS
jgi:hypothetical protein